MPHPQQLCLPDLGIGGGYLIWGVRLCVHHRHDDPAIMSAYNDLFPGEAHNIIQHINAFSSVLNTYGRRKISVRRPNCSCLTMDEVSMVSICAAALSGDQFRLEAHLRWLLGRETNLEVSNKLSDVVAIFSCHGVDIVSPQTAPPPTAFRPFTVLTGRKSAA